MSLTPPATPASPGTTSLWWYLLRRLSVTQVASLALKQAIGLNHLYILHYALNRLPPSPPMKLGGGEVERLELVDLSRLVEALPGLDVEDQLRVIRRISFYELGFRNAFKLSDGNQIAYLQWLIYPSENSLIEASCRHRYKTLAPHEVMLEQAFCMPAYRGRGFHQYATYTLLKEAREQGYRAAVTYIRKDNIVSLNNYLPMGFRITSLVREYVIGGHGFSRF